MRLKLLRQTFKQENDAFFDAFFASFTQLCNCDRTSPSLLRSRRTILGILTRTPLKRRTPFRSLVESRTDQRLTWIGRFPLSHSQNTCGCSLLNCCDTLRGQISLHMEFNLHDTNKYSPLSMVTSYCVRFYSTLTDGRLQSNLFASQAKFILQRPKIIIGGFSWKTLYPRSGDLMCWCKCF